MIFQSIPTYHIPTLRISSLTIMSPSINEQDRIDFLKTAIADLDDPVQRDGFSNNLKELAEVAVKTDDAFARVSSYFDNTVREHGSDFPGLKGYYDQWMGHENTWRTLIQQSRTLATETAASYKIYDDVLLNLVEGLTNKEDMLLLAQDMENFSKLKPVTVPDDMSRRFGTLKEEVDRFRVEFYRYLEREGTKLEQEAVDCQERIDRLKAKIDGLTAAIAAALGMIGAGAVWNLVLSAFAGLVAIGLALERMQTYKEFDAEQALLRDINRRQQALAHIKSDFDGLQPEFTLICESLQLFSDLWADFHRESLAIAEILRALPDASYPEEFKLTIELARKTAAPFQEGLRLYASTIHN